MYLVYHFVIKLKEEAAVTYVVSRHIYLDMSESLLPNCVITLLHPLAKQY